MNYRGYQIEPRITTGFHIWHERFKQPAFAFTEDEARMMIDTEEIMEAASALRLPVTKEKETQQYFHNRMRERGFILMPEYKFDKENIIDFFTPTGIAIEIKIKGGARNIYKQCERYCRFEKVKSLILLTNRSMGFPKEINGKPCYYINIGKAWL